MKLFYCYFIILSSVFVIIAAHISCRNNENQKVDWWGGFKTPEVKMADGNYQFPFFIFDSDMLDSPSMVMHPDITAKNTAMFYTLNQISTMSEETRRLAITLIYNDDIKNENVSSTYGHMKGFLFYYEGCGFYLIHSAPKYAFENGEIIYPDNALENGQSFFCITFGKRSLEVIAHHLCRTVPYFDTIEISEKYLGSQNYYKYLSKLNDTEYINDKELIPLEISSVDGLAIKIYSKSRKHYRHAWFKVSTDYSDQEFNILTWRRQHPITSKTNLHNVYTISTSYLPPWKCTKDHSKYAISITGATFCFGDLNYEVPQKARGGGLYCATDEKFTNAVRNTLRFNENPEIRNKKKKGRKNLR